MREARRRFQPGAYGCRQSPLAGASGGLRGSAAEGGVALVEDAKRGDDNQRQPHNADDHKHCSPRASPAPAESDRKDSEGYLHENDQNCAERFRRVGQQECERHDPVVSHRAVK